MRRFFLVFSSSGSLQGHRGEDGEGAEHADEYALGKHDAELRPKLEAQKHKRQQSHDRGKRAGGDGGNRTGERRFHGRNLVAVRDLFLPVAIHQNDGIVHGEHELQNGPDRCGHLIDVRKQDVRSHVEHDGDADGDEKQHGGPAMNRT